MRGCRHYAAPDPLSRTRLPSGKASRVGSRHREGGLQAVRLLHSDHPCDPPVFAGKGEKSLSPVCADFREFRARDLPMGDPAAGWLRAMKLGRSYDRLPDPNFLSSRLRTWPLPRTVVLRQTPAVKLQNPSGGVSAFVEGHSLYRQPYTDALGAFLCRILSLSRAGFLFLPNRSK
jgi:hypothetical protein